MPMSPHAAPAVPASILINKTSSSQALTSLEAAGNQLATLPDLDQLTSLQKLAAFGNQLTRLPASIGALPSLRELWLQGNLLTALPPAIGQLQVSRQTSGRCPSHLHRWWPVPKACPESCLETGNACGPLLEMCIQMEQELGRHAATTKRSNATSFMAPLRGAQALEQLSLADNQLEDIPIECKGLTSLRAFSLCAPAHIKRQRPRHLSI